MTASPPPSLSSARLPQQLATIEGLGRSGDGIARLEDGRLVFVPGTLPGERVLLRLSGDQVELLERQNDSPSRAKPSCAIADSCGGCALQHMTLPAILAWKTDRVRQALERAGFSPLPEPTVFQAPPSTRRRMDFALQRVEGGVILGLHARGGDPVDMKDCELLHPELAALLAPLRTVLASLGALTGQGSLIVNLLDSGPDLTLETSTPLSGSDRIKLADFARAWNIPRISWRSAPGKTLETVAQWKPVFHTFGETRVSPPPAAFMQATRETEAAIKDAVLAGLPALNRKDRIFELYAGCGTLTFPLGQRGVVQAYEGSKDAADALIAGTHGTRVTGQTRDLNRQPLLPQDFKHARAVVLDPPYAGAGAQIAPLARSDVRDVIYVSCNPVALEADLSHLAKAGFDVLSWTVVDQFLWSTEVESVIVLTRDAKRLKKSRKPAVA